MSQLKVCRICLNRNTKMYNINQYQLKQIYEEILTTEVKSKDNLPKWLCYECATILYKYYKFKLKCHSAQNTLKKMLNNGIVTYADINRIVKKSKEFQPHLQIINSKSNLVRTYLTQHRSQTVKPKQEIYVDEESIEDNIEDYNIASENENGNESECIEMEKYDDIEPVVDDNTQDSTNIINDSDEDDTSFLDDNIVADNNDSNVDIKNEMIDNEYVIIEVTDDKINIHEAEVVEEDIKEEYNNLDSKRLEESDVDRRKWQRTKKDLDPNLWNKYYLSDEEADKEFLARALSKKYIMAAYKCSDCFKGFSKEEMLIRHVNQRHSEAIGPFECRFCRMRFKRGCKMRVHMREHYNRYQCRQCQLVCFLETTATCHEELHNGVIRKCNQCGEEFRHSSTYYTHLRTHRSDHVCALCGASFVSPYGLHLHKKRRHTGLHLPPAEDDVPGTEEDTYCKQCDIKFETTQAYNEHLVHSAKHAPADDNSEEKKNKSKDMFKSRRNVKSQYRKGRSLVNRRKASKCYQCGEQRARRERYICELCGASLAPGSVSIHMNKHTKEKIYTCDVCGREFTTSMILKRHMLVHTGEKPYPCPLCDKRFTQTNSMKLHYRTFHLNEPYPKRNRHKKIEIRADETMAKYYRPEDSEDNIVYMK